MNCNANEKEFAELFDKYNLLTLPVIDEHSHLTGVITPGRCKSRCSAQSCRQSAVVTPVESGLCAVSCCVIKPYPELLPAAISFCNFFQISPIQITGMQHLF